MPGPHKPLGRARSWLNNETSLFEALVVEHQAWDAWSKDRSAGLLLLLDRLIISGSAEAKTHKAEPPQLQAKVEFLPHLSSAKRLEGTDRRTFGSNISHNTVLSTFQILSDCLKTPPIFDHPQRDIIIQVLTGPPKPLLPCMLAAEHLYELCRALSRTVYPEFSCRSKPGPESPRIPPKICAEPSNGDGETMAITCSSRKPSLTNS